MPSAELSSSDSLAFDFDQHQRVSTDSYRLVRDLYLRYSEVVKTVLMASFESHDVSFHKIEARAKEVESFGRKAIQTADGVLNQPKYPNPLIDITDLAGVRVIVFFPKILAAVDQCIKEEFLVIERSDKSEQLEEEGRFGYQSIHYLVKMKEERTELPEYSLFAERVAEVQARTILQHSWAEMEHDIQYKSVDVIPASIRRRFMALAGLLEIADREFQAIQDEDQAIRVKARVDVREGRLSDVEITPDALKSYLDRKLGADGRMRMSGYRWLARLLRRLGYANFQQVEECIQGFDDDRISRLLWGARQGQISRFEDLLLAGGGQCYIGLHPWSVGKWWRDRLEACLDKLRAAGIELREYNPEAQEQSTDLKGGLDSSA
jgi:putative GTP pyrophosphokinase